MFLTNKMYFCDLRVLQDKHVLLFQVETLLKEKRKRANKEELSNESEPVTVPSSTEKAIGNQDETWNKMVQTKWFLPEKKELMECVML